MLRHVLCTAFLLTLLVAPQAIAHADDRGPTDHALRAEDKAFFAWWDALDYPDMGSLPFVEVTTGNWTQATGEDPQPEVEHGFLVSESAGMVRVFLTDLSTSVLTIETVPDQPWKSVRKAPADLAAFVTRGLAARRAHRDAGARWGQGPDPFRAHRWAVPDQSWRMCVLARAVAARGREDLARALLDLAFVEGTRTAGGAPPEVAEWARYYASVRGAIAEEAWRVWQKDFEASDVSLEELAREAERLARGFEQGTQGLTAPSRWSRSAAALRRIARDVAAHRAQRAAAGPPTSTQERIADLVPLLPTVRARWVQQGSGWVEGPPTPADELVAIGLPAVPALIRALDDGRFTRRLHHTMTHKGQRRDAWRVLRVNEVAYDALRRLAAGALPEYGDHAGFPTAGSAAHAALVDRVRAWHAQVLARGEGALLAEIARRGDRTSYDAANRLAQLDPEAALAPTLAGIRAARHASFRHNLMLVLCRLPREAGWPAIEGLLEASEDIGVRFTAASALLHRKPEASLPVLIEVWSRPAAAAVPLDPSVPGSPALPDLEVLRRREEARYLLAASGRAAAVEALAAGLEARGARARLAVVVALVTPPALAAFQLLPIGFGGVNAVAVLPMTPAAAAAVERTLAGRLEDTARVDGLDLVIDGVWLDPVIGEVAAWGLARRFPERWVFDPSATAEVRTRARLTAANAWRARHGKPSLPLPEVRARPRALALADILAPLHVAAVGIDATARARARSQLAVHGLAVLPALREGLDKVTGDAPGRNELDALVRRLSLTVAEVTFTADAPPPDVALRTLLEAKIGQTFSGELYTSILLHVARHMPDGAAGLRLAALREEPATGVRIEVELLANKVPAAGTQTGWNAGGPEVRVGKRWDGGGGAFFSWAHGREAAAWAPWARRIDEWLAKGAPEDRITVRGRLVGTR